MLYGTGGVYTPDSLKESTRGKRGKGVRRKVFGKTKLPGNWMDFLRDSVNKKELFAFLTSKDAQFSWPPAKAVYVTSGQAVVCIGDSIPMQNCNHEEADTRIVVHVLHALNQGEQTICVRLSTQMLLSSLLAHSMICLRLNLWSTSGWPLAWARITGVTTSTPSVKAWGNHNREHYLCSTHFPGATQFLPSTARARSRFGRPGRHLKT